MATTEKDKTSSYPLYGQDPMTEEARAAFLQNARDQEKAYDAYVAEKGRKNDYPHEHLPDMDDPQHQFRDPNHPINLRATIALDELNLAALGNRIQDELNSPYDSAGRLESLKAAYEQQRFELEERKAILLSKEASKGAEAAEAKSNEVKLNEDKLNNAPESKPGADSKVAWHKTELNYANYPLHLTAEFKHARDAGLAELLAREKRDVTFIPVVAESSAKALYTNDKEGPTDISWHKAATVNSYSNAISQEQFTRTAESYRLSRALERSAGGTLQQTAEMKHSVQAGDVEIHNNGLGGSGKNAFSVLPVMGKAFAAHTLAPLGTEAVLQADAAKDVLDKAEKDFARGRLTQEQLAIVRSNTKTTAAEASAVAIVPEPGLGMDKVVQAGDRKLVAELVQAGVPKQQAEGYEMGSMIEGGHRLAAFVSDTLANRNDVKQMVDVDAAVPLSMALNINQSQLRQFGAMSATLGGEALKNEVARNPAFERLAHLSPQKIEGLSQMAAAGVDPLVMDRGYITTKSNRPAQLSADPKVAFIESANYIMQSGDADFRVPGNRPVALKATVESFANTYQHLAQDGGLSIQDKTVLKMTMDTLSKGIETNQVQGLVTKYEASHHSAAANESEHAVLMQR